MTQDSYRGDYSDPQTLHRYAFVQNNPINNIDSYGFRHREFQTQYQATMSAEAFLTEFGRLEQEHMETAIKIEEARREFYRKKLEAEKRYYFQKAEYEKQQAKIEEAAVWLQSVINTNPSATLYYRTAEGEVLAALFPEGFRKDKCRGKVKERDQWKCAVYEKEKVGLEYQEQEGENLAYRTLQFMQAVEEATMTTGDILTFGFFSETFERTGKAGERLAQEGITSETLGNAAYELTVGTVKTGSSALLTGITAGETKLLITAPFTLQKELEQTTRRLETRTETAAERETVVAEKQSILSQQRAQPQFGPGAMNVNEPVRRDNLIKVYRVYGGKAKAFGKSWTSINPNLVENYRNEAGLPIGNTGRFVIEGTINKSDILLKKTAAPSVGNEGGLLEYILDPSKVNINRVSGVNPPF